MPSRQLYITRNISRHLKKWGNFVKKCLTVLLLAVIILASFTVVEAKNQNAQQNSNVNSKIEGGHHNSISTEVTQIGPNAQQDSNVDSEIKGGHHNSIVTDVNQISQIEVGKNNNIPYGQLKKLPSFDSNGESTNTNVNQFANIINEIIGGHHNTIAVDNKQVALLGGYLDPTSNWGNGNYFLNQTANIDNQILGGHHNTIVVDNNQVAFLGGPLDPASKSGAGSTSLNQTVNFDNQIIGGHHNVILLGSIQEAYMNGMASGTSGNISQTGNFNNQIIGGNHNIINVDSSQVAQIGSIGGKV